jgi:hypothetical protein
MAGLTNCGRAVRIGRQIRESLESMPALRKLSLFSERPKESIFTWSILSKTRSIPTLEVLRIEDFMMSIRDFADFVLKHNNSLKSLTLGRIRWPDGNSATLGNIYGELGKVQKFERIYQRNCSFGRRRPPDIPMHLVTPWCSDEEDEDGYIHVKKEASTFYWKGKEMVSTKLEELAAYMCRK